MDIISKFFNKFKNVVEEVTRVVAPKEIPTDKTSPEWFKNVVEDAVAPKEIPTDKASPEWFKHVLREAAWDHKAFSTPAHIATIKALDKKYYAQLGALEFLRDAELEAHGHADTVKKDTDKQLDRADAEWKRRAVIEAKAHDGPTTGYIMAALAGIKHGHASDVMRELAAWAKLNNHEYPYYSAYQEAQKTDWGKDFVADVDARYEAQVRYND